jgi:hypothetical protein
MHTSCTTFFENDEVLNPTSMIATVGSRLASVFVIPENAIAITAIKPILFIPSSLSKSLYTIITLKVVVAQIPFLINIRTSAHRTLPISYIPHACPPNRNLSIQSRD